MQQGSKTVERGTIKHYIGGVVTYLQHKLHKQEGKQSQAPRLPEKLPASPTMYCQTRRILSN